MQSLLTGDLVQTLAIGSHGKGTISLTKRMQTISPCTDLYKVTSGCPRQECLLKLRYTDFLPCCSAHSLPIDLIFLFYSFSYHMRVTCYLKIAHLFGLRTYCSFKGTAEPV